MKKVRRPRGGRSLLLGLIAGLVSVIALAAHGVADPGHPGVPHDPEILFEEDFENVADPATGLPLPDYTGAPPLAMTYTADPAWLNTAACNGVIASFNSTTGSSGCPAAVYNQFVRAIARGMGAALGGGDDNHVMSDVTISGFPAPPTPAATLETASPIALPSPNRFVTFSIDAGAVTCNRAQPLLRFFLLDGDDEIPITNNAINACTDPRGTTVSGVRVGSYASDTSILFSGSSLGVKLTNDQTSGAGNDYAVDNLRVLDVTPQLDKDFEPEETLTGVPATLTFTITNTSELAEKPGWSFIDNLPSGLEVASPSGATTDCPNGAVTATPGGSTIEVAGDLATGQTSCQVTVEVVASEPGTYENCPGNVTDVVGLDPPACSELVVLPRAELSLEKSAAQIVASGAEIVWTLTVTNGGPDPSSGSTVTDQLPAEVTDPQTETPGCEIQGLTLTCEVGPLAVGGTHEIVVTATAPETPQTCFENSASVEGNEGELEPGDNEASVRSCTPPVAELALSKDAPAEVSPGGEVTWTLTVTNNGPDPSTGSTVTDQLPAEVTDPQTETPGCEIQGLTLTCDVGPLAVGGTHEIVVSANAPDTFSTCFENEASVEGTEGDFDLTNNVASAETCTPPDADLSLAKSGPARVRPGARITWTITVTNNGPGTSSGSTVTDSFPGRVGNPTTQTPGCAITNRTLECAIGELAVGASTEIVVRGRAPRKARTCVTNTASVEGQEEDLAPGNNSASVRTCTRGVPRLRLAKRAGKAVARPGETISYRIVVRNVGNGPAKRVRVCDRPHADLEIIRAPKAKKATPSSACWVLNGLKAGKQRTFRVVARVKTSAQPGSKPNRATAMGPNTKRARSKAAIRVKLPAGVCAAWKVSASC